MDQVATDPGLCRHLEIEIQTWDILPAEERTVAVPDQIAADYEWLLARLQQRGLRPAP
jgi:hypothetical protein